MSRRPFYSDKRVKRLLEQGRTVYDLLRFGVEHADQQPQHLVAKIGRCLTLWPEIEARLTSLLASLMQADTEATAAVFLKLRRSVARSEAIEAAAKIALPELDRIYLDVIMRFVSSVESHRNALAHGHWGATPVIPDAIVWLEGNEASLLYADIRRGNRTGRYQNNDHAKFFFYLEEDFNFILGEISIAIKILDIFNNYLDGSRDRVEQFDAHRRLGGYAAIKKIFAEDQAAFLRDLEKSGGRQPLVKKHPRGQKCRYCAPGANIGQHA